MTNTKLNENFRKDGLGAALGPLGSHRVLVFGGSGLIGNNLVSLLDCAAPSSRECDIRDFDETSCYIRDYKPTLVINLAGQSNYKLASESYDLNVNGVRNICYALSTFCGGAKFFQAGSINQVLKPADEYSIQKGKAEKIALSYSRILDVTVARLCTVEDRFRGQFIVSQIVKGVSDYANYKTKFTIDDFGAKKWVCSASDLCVSIVRSCEEGEAGTFYFGPELPVSLDEIFCAACLCFEINVTKIGKTWMDADTGRPVATSKNNSNDSSLYSFGKPSGGKFIQSDLSKIIRSIAVSVDLS